MNGSEDSAIDLIGSWLFGLTADGADLRRYHACDLRPSVLSPVYFQRSDRTQHTNETDDRPILVVASIVDRLDSMLSGRLHRNIGNRAFDRSRVGCRNLWWLINRRGDGQRKRSPSEGPGAARQRKQLGSRKLTSLCPMYL